MSSTVRSESAGEVLDGRVTLARLRRPLAADGEAPGDRSQTKEVVKTRPTSVNAGAPIVEEMLRFEDLPPGSLARRRAIRSLERRLRRGGGPLLHGRGADLRGRPGRQHPGRDPVAAPPPRPRLAAVVETGRPVRQSVSPSEAGSQCWQRRLRRPKPRFATAHSFSSLGSGEQTLM
jgi:hypothetical protein